MTETESLEGWVPEMGHGVTLEEVIERAFDYRGNVTVVKTDGTRLEGYVFNRNRDLPMPFIQVFDGAGGGPFDTLDARASRLAPPAFVVSAGVCGALSPDLAEGDLVVPETVLGPTGARYATAEVAGLRRAGVLATVDEVLATPAAKARLWVEAGALACDMESAAILEWARSRGMPAAVVRAVSDTAERGVPADLAAVVEPDGRVRTLRAVRAVLARPRAFADALALRSGTHVALRTVARALGRIARAPRPPVK